MTNDGGGNATMRNCTVTRCLKLDIQPVAAVYLENLASATVSGFSCHSNLVPCLKLVGIPGPTLRLSTFVNNTHDLVGTVSVGTSTVGVVEDCNFENNTGSRGGDLDVSAGDVTALRCRFVGSSAMRGGAINSNGATVLSVVDSTIESSSAEIGGAIYCNDVVNLRNVTVRLFRS